MIDVTELLGFLFLLNPFLAYFECLVHFFGCVVLLAMTSHFYFLTLTFSCSCPAEGKGVRFWFPVPGWHGATVQPTTQSPPLPLAVPARSRAISRRLSFECRDWKLFVGYKADTAAAASGGSFDAVQLQARETLIEMLPAWCTCKQQLATCKRMPAPLSCIAHTLRPLCNLFKTPKPETETDYWGRWRAGGRAGWGREWWVGRRTWKRWLRKMRKGRRKACKRKTR